MADEAGSSIMPVPLHLHIAPVKRLGGKLPVNHSQPKSTGVQAFPPDALRQLLSAPHSPAAEKVPPPRPQHSHVITSHAVQPSLGPPARQLFWVPLQAITSEYWFSLPSG